MTEESKVEPVLLLLFGGIVFFTLMLFVSERFFPMDGQIFQVISGLLTGFGGAFMMRVKPRDTPSAPPGTIAQVTSTTQTTAQEFPKPSAQ